ncbi:hypothetical protein MNBD_NITROSPIRAE01-232 [hydrothermal vent metagenome]|uniref:Uncharacterized protein n=1 Tax=hydrothermal vent metagenome TaxID=652676 RepID=A0A3B1D8F9_9ZZZZ
MAFIKYGFILFSFVVLSACSGNTPESGAPALVNDTEVPDDDEFCFQVAP